MYSGQASDGWGEGGETMVSVERFGDFPYLLSHIGETESLRALNALAEKLSRLEEWQADAFKGLVVQEGLTKEVLARAGYSSILARYEQVPLCDRTAVYRTVRTVV